MSSSLSNVILKWPLKRKLEKCILSGKAVMVRWEVSFKCDELRFNDPFGFCKTSLCTVKALQTQVTWPHLLTAHTFSPFPVVTQQRPPRHTDDSS